MLSILLLIWQMILKGLIDFRQIISGVSAISIWHIKTHQNLHSLCKKLRGDRISLYQVDPLVCPRCKGIMRTSASSKTSKSSVIFSRIWVSGLCDQDRRRKSVPSHYPNQKSPIPTRIRLINKPTVTPTRNTPGMITYSHNAIMHLKT